jgi:lysophospholipase L1-like esterase
MIGTNNRQASAEEVAEGIRLCVNAIRKKQPQAVVLLHPMIPRISPDLKWLREKNDRTNELIKPLADGEKVIWVDLRPIFENVSPEKQKQFLPDGTHPNAEAYRLWRETVTPYFEKIVGEGKR